MVTTIQHATHGYLFPHALIPLLTFFHQVMNIKHIMRPESFH